jgi:hypothetical protein
MSNFEAHIDRSNLLGIEQQEIIKHIIASFNVIAQFP